MLSPQVEASDRELHLDVSNIKLFAGDHAIEDTTFGVSFSEPLTSADFQRFAEQHQAIQAEFASITDISGFQLTIDNELPTMNPTVSGKQLAHYAPDGRMIWAGEFSENSIRISCKSYSGWTGVWVDAKKKLELLLGLVDRKKLVISIDLFVTDTFSIQAPQKIRPADLFNRESRYVGEHVLSIQDGRWDNQIGWFERFSETQDKLVRFDTRAARRNQDYVVTIANLQSLRPSSTPEPLDALIQDNLEKLDVIISSFHKSNKKLLSLVLDNRIAKRMGL